MANRNLRIKAICRSRGILMKDLAQRLGKHPVYFSQATGRGSFSLSTLSRIADELGVEIPELFEACPRPVEIVCPACGARLTAVIENGGE